MDLERNVLLAPCAGQARKPDKRQRRVRIPTRSLVHLRRWHTAKSFSGISLNATTSQSNQSRPRSSKPPRSQKLDSVGSPGRPRVVAVWSLLPNAQRTPPRKRAESMDVLSTATAPLGEIRPKSHSNAEFKRSPGRVAFTNVSVRLLWEDEAFHGHASICGFEHDSPAVLAGVPSDRRSLL